MTRAALRKTQTNLFAAGPAASVAPQSAGCRETIAHLHFCEAPGCTAWGAFGIGVFRGVRGRLFCTSHKPAEHRP